MNRTLVRVTSEEMKIRKCNTKPTGEITIISHVRLVSSCGRSCQIKLTSKAHLGALELIMVLMLIAVNTNKDRKKKTYQNLLI